MPGDLLPLPNDLRDALGAILSRQKQLHAIWHKALAAYFEPNSFLIEVQNCITVSRSVTFIVQSQKGKLPDFDRWYSGFATKFAADPVMQWAKNARNKIEKQGDLETLSQVRAELIAAYAYHPKTPWIPESIGWSPKQFLRSIPAHLLDAHVVEHGVLAIERRWVDSELPDREILDGLAHVYGQLALMIVSLHQHCRVVIPEQNASMGEHILANLLEDGRTPSMARPFDDRGVYVSIKDGRIVRYKRDIREIDVASSSKAKRRYKAAGAWNDLVSVSSLLDVAKIYFRNARKIMVRDGHHVTLYVLLKDNTPFDMIVAPPRHRMDKYLIPRDVGHIVKRLGADGLLFISEAWTASLKDVPKGGFAEDAPNRGESLTLAAIDASGQYINLSAQVVRKKNKPLRVERLQTTEIETSARMLALAPVLDVWGQLDILRLTEDSKENKWMERHFEKVPSETY